MHINQIGLPSQCPVYVLLVINMLSCKRKLTMLCFALFLLAYLSIPGCGSREKSLSQNPTATTSMPAWTWHSITPGQTTREQAKTVLKTVLPPNTLLLGNSSILSWDAWLAAEPASAKERRISSVRFDQGIVEDLRIWEPNGTLADAVSAYGTPTFVVNALLGFEDPRLRVGFAYPEKGLVLMTGWGPLWDPEIQEIQDAGMGIIPQPEMLVLQTYYFTPRSVEEFEATFPFSSLGRDISGGNKGPWTRPWKGWGE